MAADRIEPGKRAERGRQKFAERRSADGLIDRDQQRYALRPLALVDHLDAGAVKPGAPGRIRRGGDCSRKERNIGRRGVRDRLGDHVVRPVGRMVGTLDQRQPGNDLRRARVPQNLPPGAVVVGPGVQQTEIAARRIDRLQHRAGIVMDLLRKVAVEQQAAIIAVTHDEKIFDRFDHIFHLRDGRLDNQEP